MAQSFSVNDAKSVLARHKDILTRLDTIGEKYQKWESFAMFSARKLAKRGAFSKLAEEELRDKREHYADDQEFYGLLQEIYISLQLSSLKKQVEALEKNPLRYIRQSMEKLKPALGRFSRLFMVPQRKEAAEKAYEYLQGLLIGDFPVQVKEILSQLEAAEDPDQEEVLKCFNRNRQFFYSELKRIAPDVRWDVFSERTLGSVTTSLKRIIASLDQCEQSTRDSKGMIEKNIFALAARQSMRAIQEVPVEELRSAKDGLRVKALRDAGFENLADIHSASVHQLSSVYGISEDTAHTIKRYAKEMVANIQRTTKIKLSADNRTDVASNVVEAVYAYLRHKPDIDNYEKLKSQGIGIIKNDLELLSSIGNGAKLLFSNPAEKRSIYDSYQRACWLRDNNFASLIDKTAAGLNAKTTFSSQEAWQSFVENPVAFFNVIEEVVPGALGNEDSLYGLPEDLAQEIQDEAFFPDGLLCTLRRYQEWGVKYILHQEKALLGDEMGLGKTIQAIAAMVSLKNTGEKHFLVVCPASVIANWFREIRKNSKLRATIIHGNTKKTALQDWIKTGGVAVTSYETTGIFKLEASFRIGMLVVDEAHYIKNFNARRSENVRNLCGRTERVLFMTGTPLENRADEMVSLISVLRPDIAGKISDMTYMSRAPQFREAVAPVYYRRKREDVLTELPDLVETEEWCTLLPQEENVYEQSVLGKHYAAARRVSWTVGDPELSSKANRLRELVEEAAADDRKVIVFSFFLDTIDMVIRTLGDRCLNPINGSVSPQRRQEILDEFDKAPAGTVLPAQIVSGGTGLNIQCASVVIICEPQLKPSIENQAISRAYRMECFRFPSSVRKQHRRKDHRHAP